MKTDTTRKGRYKVLDGTTEISQHNDSTEAQNVATNLAYAHPGKVYTISPPVIEVVADEPVPKPSTPPVPVPTPTPTPVPVTGVIRVLYTDPIDNSGRYRDVAYDRMLFVAKDGSGSGSMVDPLHPSKIAAQFKPGTLFMFRGGQYAEAYVGNWGVRNFALGPTASGVIFMGAEGEDVEFIAPGTDLDTGTNFILYDGSGYADNVTISGFKLTGNGACLMSGYGTITNGIAEKGAKNLLFLKNLCSSRYTNNSMSGLIGVNGDGGQVLGNIFEKTGWTQFYNNNHATYVQAGASNVLVEANLYRNLQVGHVIQVHEDGVAQTYTNVTIRRNKIIAANPMDCRGMTVSNVSDQSTVLIEENWLENVGQQFAALSVYGGQVTARKNTLKDILAGQAGKVWLSEQYGHNPTLYWEASNQIIGGSGQDFGSNPLSVSNIKR